jgi:hypothetical protein
MTGPFLGIGAGWFEREHSIYRFGSSQATSVAWLAAGLRRVFPETRTGTPLITRA